MAQLKTQIDGLLNLMDKQLHSNDDNIYIGIDGGGTSTKICIIDVKGKILSSGVYGPSNYNNVGFENASKNVFTGIDKLLGECNNKNKTHIDGMCLTLAGCDRDDDKKKWNEACLKWLSSSSSSKQVQIKIYNDSVGTLASVSPYEMSGIIVICGTGFIVCGYNGDPDNYIRCGGWGPLLGDPCSGYAIGEAILRAAAYYHDGGTKTLLLNALMETCKIDKFDQIISWAYHNENNYATIASLAPLAIEYYNKDMMAQQIIDNALKNLINRILIILNKLYPIDNIKLEKNIQNIQIVCSGSLFAKSKFFLQLFQKQLLWELGGDARQCLINLTIPEQTSDYGAALLIKNICLGLFKFSKKN